MYIAGVGIYHVWYRGSDNGCVRCNQWFSLCKLHSMDITQHTVHTYTALLLLHEAYHGRVDRCNSDGRLLLTGIRSNTCLGIGLYSLLLCDSLGLL